VRRRRLLLARARNGASKGLEQAARLGSKWIGNRTVGME